MTETIMLSRRVFMIFGQPIFGQPLDGPPIGTGFQIQRAGCVLTASHVLNDQDRVLVVNTSGSQLDIIESERIIKHPKADLAAIMIPSATREKTEYYELGTPPAEYGDFPLGEEVASYGYPKLAGEMPVAPRLMKGHIQRRFEYQDDPYAYAAFELSFPSFPGQSGSPIFLDNLTTNARNQAIGIVTRTTSFTSEEQGEITVAAWWAVGASLTPLRSWIEGLHKTY